MSGYRFSNEPGMAERLQRESREEMKLRLLRDIRTDMAVCEVEGWSKTGYIDELIEMLEELKEGGQYGSFGSGLYRKRSENA